MRRLGTLVLLLSATSLASSVLKVSVQSEHFGRTEETVMGMSADGRSPDERGWRERAKAKLQQEVDQLERALPRLRQGFPAARSLVPLTDPSGIRRQIDLSGKGWGWVEISLREVPTAQDLEALRRAMAQELQMVPLERKRFRPVPIIFGSMAAIAVVGGITALVLRRRRRRATQV